MDMFSNLEVSITLHDEKYKAKSPAFPQCVGIGLTEEAALKSLSRSIARFISKISNEALSSVFLSDRYSEVILDTTSDDKKQSRVYSLESGFMSFAKQLYLKVKKSPKDDDSMAFDIDPLLKNEMTRPTSSVQTELLESSGLKIQQKEDSADGGIVFGFMVNFN